MNTNLVGKRALVCGSTQGIGRACAQELALLGCRVTLLARDADRLRTVTAELPTPASQKHDFLVADFSSPETVKVAAASAAEGSDPCHILINNTGGPPGGPALDASTEAYLAAFSAHIVCNQILLQALVPGMKAATFGRILNIISTSVKAPIPNLGVSNTIRAAVASWAKTLANELGPFGITVNNILPGFTDTARLTELFKSRAAKTGKPLDAVTKEAIATIPAGRLGRPEEIAAAAAFLATPAAAYINGINLPVDGGRLGTL
ncbi:MAG: SDR family oxidoreductase [Phycisphaeraceae bacterium]|nr:SDR family oxidoreductase [Phycisphaeraceae bacterium]